MKPIPRRTHERVERTSGKTVSSGVHIAILKCYTGWPDICERVIINLFTVRVFRCSGESCSRPSSFTAHGRERIPPTPRAGLAGGLVCQQSYLSLISLLSVQFRTATHMATFSSRADPLHSGPPLRPRARDAAFRPVVRNCRPTFGCQTRPHILRNSLKPIVDG